MDEAQHNELVKIYNQMCSLIDGLTSSIDSLTLTDGTGQRFNGYLDRAKELTGDIMILDYKVNVIQSQRTSVGEFVKGSDYSRNLFGATMYLHKQHLDDDTLPPKRHSGSSSVPHTPISNYITQQQENLQSTDVNVQFNFTLMQLSELLTKAEQEHPDETTPENKFIKTFKKLLPAAKDTLSIISLLLTTAAQLGLSPQEVAKILHLG